METNDRREGRDRRNTFRMFQFLERRAHGRERRQEGVDAWGEPIARFEATAPPPHRRVYDAEV